MLKTIFVFSFHRSSRVYVQHEKSVTNKCLLLWRSITCIVLSTRQTHSRGVFLMFASYSWELLFEIAWGLFGEWIYWLRKKREKRENVCRNVYYYVDRALSKTQQEELQWEGLAPVHQQVNVYHFKMSGFGLFQSRLNASENVTFEKASIRIEIAY